MPQQAIACALMRGGTSRGLYFLAQDLPSDFGQLQQVLLAAMGSPDVRQIDGVGGAHPLTSKVAIVSKSDHPDADVDYHFWQVKVDEAGISDSQNCGNILAGVGPFAIERGLVPAAGDITPVRIRMRNTDSFCVANVQTPGGQVEYQGHTAIDGVPGTHAPISIDFLDVAGSSCGSLLPTGNAIDQVKGYDVTCIDNGMPVVLLNASQFDLQGNESPAELEANDALRARLEAIRLEAGQIMNLGEVGSKTVPKMSLLSSDGQGRLTTRTFIPHRVHESIGVLGAVSVATGLAVKGSVAQRVTGMELGSGTHQIEVGHPTGSFQVELQVQLTDAVEPIIARSALVRTARMLMDGKVYVPAVTGENK